MHPFDSERGYSLRLCFCCESAGCPINNCARRMCRKQYFTRFNSMCPPRLSTSIINCQNRWNLENARRTALVLVPTPTKRVLNRPPSLFDVSISLDVREISSEFRYFVCQVLVDTFVSGKDHIAFFSSDRTYRCLRPSSLKGCRE